MKTFHQFMEQIPHVEPSAQEVATAHERESARRWHRRHVHRELAQTAAQERQDKLRTPMA